MSDSGSSTPRPGRRFGKLRDKLRFRHNNKDPQSGTAQNHGATTADNEHAQAQITLNVTTESSPTTVTDRKTDNACLGVPPAIATIPKAIDAPLNMPSRTSCPINELWNEAYDELKDQEPDLIKNYESIISNDLSSMIGSSIGLSGTEINRRQHMQALLARKLEESKKNLWKLKFGDHEVSIKDLAEPVVGIVEWADEYVADALSANPYASLAWTGVMLMLPLVLNPSKQAASLASVLDYISDLIVRSSMREALYERRYPSRGSDDDRKAFISSHVMYRDTLKKLYIEILKLEAKTICYMSRNGATRLASAIVKWDKWDELLNDVKVRESAFQQVYDIWKDVRDQEEGEGHVNRHQEKMSSMNLISADVSGLRSAIEDANRETRRNELLEWLSSTDPSQNFNSAIDKHQVHTGKWLLEGEDFETWKETPNSLLWLNGNAGSGKSVLSASVIRHLTQTNESNPEIAVVYFYFSFSDTEKQSTLGMLSSIIKQLCCHHPYTPSPVDSLRKHMEKSHRPDRKSLEEALLATMHGFSDVYLVLDALDESPMETQERSLLLETLLRIHKERRANLHLFLTSRREADIEAELMCVCKPHEIIDINLSRIQTSINKDIALYIDQTFEKLPFRDWPDGIKEEAKYALIEKAYGMFQYVSCQFDALRPHKTPGTIRKALKDLPAGLDETYHRMLESIKPEYKHQVASLLKWLAYSLRPLCLHELAEIFILDPQLPIPFNEDDRLFRVEDVLDYLPGLVEEIPYTRSRSTRQRNEINFKIRFAHFSIKEYLSSTRMTQVCFATSERASHLHISECCLAYHVQLSRASLVIENMLTKYGLWEYVGENWVEHIEKIPPRIWTDSICHNLALILEPGSQAFHNVVRLGLWSKLREDEQLLPTPLHYTAYMGAVRLSTYLIQHGAKIDELSPDANKFGTPLQAAAAGGQHGTVTFLLQNGANVNIQAGRYGNALQAAARTGDEHLIRTLLSHGADINAKGGAHGTALIAAVSARWPSIAVTTLLLDKGADINARNGNRGPPLLEAIIHGHPEIVQLLLSRGAEIHAKTVGKLVEASLRRHSKKNIGEDDLENLENG